ncbi:MAG: hypothetical protein UU47_C0002G0026 [candidate division TM6 bacterium GW2011_GWE2_41_16]|nr:MAG: hypothetical protein UU47_C0002G0026 [candidate division TM6 bacterium GW2011_GWE2_41_16]
MSYHLLQENDIDTIEDFIHEATDFLHTTAPKNTPSTSQTTSTTTTTTQQTSTTFSNTTPMRNVVISASTRSIAVQPEQNTSSTQPAFNFEAMRREATRIESLRQAAIAAERRMLMQKVEYIKLEMLRFFDEFQKIKNNPIPSAVTQFKEDFTNFMNFYKNYQSQITQYRLMTIYEMDDLITFPQNVETFMCGFDMVQNAIFSEELIGSFTLSQCYNILELSEDERNQEKQTVLDLAKKQYHKLALIYHPDRVQEKTEQNMRKATAQFKLISHAFNTIINHPLNAQ